MIITQTPLRMSFAGGGSDLPSFYKQFGGAVVSTAVDKFVYINVNRKFDEAMRVSYSRTEEVATVAEIHHPLVRHSLQMLGMDGGLEITSIADIPSRGTGLGSSSSFTVGLLHALHAFRCESACPDQLADEACKVELELCGDPIGKQDQYAAAFGGFHFYRFHPDGSVTVEPITCPAPKLQELQASLLTLYTGQTRQASSILAEQSELAIAEPATRRTLQRISELAFALKTELNSGNIDSFGEILHAGWRLKRQLHSAISSSVIDECYATAIRNGATGGKLLGAGGGGFLTFVARPERHDAIAEALGLRRVDVQFCSFGSRVLLNNG